MQSGKTKKLALDPDSTKAGVKPKSLEGDYQERVESKMDPKTKAVIDHHLKRSGLMQGYANKSAKTSEGKPDVGRQNLGKQQLKSFSLTDRLKYKGSVAAGKIATTAGNMKNALMGKPPAGPKTIHDSSYMNKPAIKPAGGQGVQQTKAQSNQQMPGVNSAMPGKSSAETNPEGMKKPKMNKSLNDLHDIMKGSSNPFKGSKGSKTTPNPKGFKVKMSGTAGQSAKSKGYSTNVSGGKTTGKYKPPKDNSSAPPPPKQPEPPKQETAKEPQQPKSPKEPQTTGIGVKKQYNDESAHGSLLAHLAKLIQPNAPPVINKIAHVVASYQNSKK